MSFVGRAAVWGHVNGAGNVGDGVRPNRFPVATGTRRTPLNVMTGSRIAASGPGVVAWVDDGQAWQAGSERIAPRLAAHLRRPYQQIFEAIRARANEVRSCPRCGQAQHLDWGQAYERLVCTQITSA